VSSSGHILGITTNGTLSWEEHVQPDRVCNCNCNPMCPQRATVLILNLDVHTSSSKLLSQLKWIVVYQILAKVQLTFITKVHSRVVRFSTNVQINKPNT